MNNGLYLSAVPAGALSVTFGDSSPRGESQGRFAPRNDKLGSLAPQNVCRKDCQTAWRSGSAATDTIGTHHFNGGLYELQMPSRDCHVGLRPPRNDKSEGHCGQRCYSATCQPARRSLSAAIFSRAAALCSERRCRPRRDRFPLYRRPVRVGSIAGPGCPFPCNDHTVRSASVTGTTLCRTASVVSICRPTRPPLKQTVSPSAIVASANVGNCFFMPMGLQPPWI